MCKTNFPGTTQFGGALLPRGYGTVTYTLHMSVFN